MPMPHKGESEAEYVKRCIPVLVGEGKAQDQAVAECYALFKEHHKKEAQVRTKDISGVLPADLQLLENDGRHIVKAIITADIVDSDGEAVLSDGVDYTTRYAKNPVGLLAHDKKTPVAKCIAIDRHDRFLEATFEFPLRPDETTLPKDAEWPSDTAYAKIKAGILNGVSIGFDPATVEERKPTARDRELFGPAVKSVISKLELAEVSFVTVPANMLTLVTAVKEAKFGQHPNPEIELVKAELAAAKAEAEAAKKELADLKAKAEVPFQAPTAPAPADPVELATKAAATLMAQVDQEVERQWALRQGKFFN